MIPNSLEQAGWGVLGRGLMGSTGSCTDAGHQLFPLSLYVSFPMQTKMIGLDITLPPCEIDLCKYYGILLYSAVKFILALNRLR